MSEQYPGGTASIEQVLDLAREYHRAAQVLLDNRRKGHPLSLAPFRLAAIHALELYLNALLRHEGHAPPEIRGLQHDLALRSELVQQSGLTLRKRTAAHLEALAKTREYLVTRYDPELVKAASHINRLMATLEEVSQKTTARIGKAAPVKGGGKKVA